MDNSNGFSGLNDMRRNVDKMINDFHKTLGPNINKLGQIMKQAEFKKERKGKVNKCNATMFLANDNSVKIVFDNAEDGIKFFEGKK